MKSEDIKNAAKDLGGSASKNAAETKEGLHDAASDALDKGQRLGSQAGDTAGDLYGQAKDTVGRASSKIADAMPGSAAEAAAAGRRAYDGGIDQLARQVVKQPLEALLLAGAIGYLVGWATSRS